MATPHNSAEKGDFAKTVLMPGDPLRAKFIAENFLTDVKCVNEVRGMLGFTGKYEGKEVSVMGHGMGIPSIAIYTYELFNFYDVDNIIRVGSAGGLQDDVNVMDIILQLEHIQILTTVSSLVCREHSARQHLITSWRRLLILQRTRA